MRRFASAVAVAVALAAASAGAAVQATPRPPSGAALTALAQPPMRPPLASQRIYFVMPDRYANGNPANDRGGLSGPRDVTGYDPTDTGYYHGGDLAGLTGDCTGPRGLARVKDLGFTSIWVTPPYRQKYVQDGSAAYHGYWALGFDGVDPHLGTEADFRAFVDCAHSLGLKVILDVVVNHTADVIRLPSNDYGPPKTPFVPPEERNVKSPAWLNDTSNYHNRGNIDFNSCPPACLELGDFFGLDDLATEQADVRAGLVDVFAGWISRYRIDGFRIDTARHVERGFFVDWVPRILAAARAAGVPDFQLFGEAFITNAVELSEYVRDRGLPNVLDFPMQDALARFAGGQRRRRRNRDAAQRRRLLRRAERRTTRATDLPRKPRHRARRAAGAGQGRRRRGRAAAAEDAARLRPPLPAPRGAGRLLRRRVRDRRTRRRQGSASRPLPDAGAGVAERGAHRERPDRHRVVVRRRGAPDRGAAARARRPCVPRTRCSRRARRSCAARRAPCSPRAGSTRPAGASTSRSSTRADRRRGSRSRPQRRCPNGHASSGRRRPPRAPGRDR